MDDRDASQTTQRKRIHTHTAARRTTLLGPGKRHNATMLAALLALPLIVLLALASCSPSQSGQSSTTQTPASTAAATSTARPAGIPSTTPIAITDLNAFREKLSTSFSTNKWSNVTPLLSPNFSFAGTDTTASQLVMPASAHDMEQLYNSQGPWSQSSQYEVDIRDCIAGPTPKEQQMGFDGGGGSFILIGIGRWQNYWVVAWAFQDPLGGYDACAHE